MEKQKPDRNLKQTETPVPPGKAQQGDLDRLDNIERLKRGEITELPKVKHGYFCNGRSHDSQRYCTRRAGWGTTHKNEGRCKAHGGNSPAGVFSPHFKTGKYASWLPHHLATKYEKAMKDEKWIRLRNEIGLCDARLYDLTQNLNRTPGSKLQAQVSSAFLRLRQALGEGNANRAMTAMTELGTLLEDIKKEGDLWSEIGTWMDRRQRLTEAEVRHAVHTQSVMTARDVMILVDQLVRIIREHVSDRRQLNQIAQGIQTIIPTGTSLLASHDDEGVI